MQQFYTSSRPEQFWAAFAFQEIKLTKEEKAKVVAALLDALNENLGNRLTSALANGMLLAVDQAMPVAPDECLPPDPLST